MAEAPPPMIIQGGMGVGVSNWRLARAVARRGHLGVVSGTCVDSLLVRRLEDGDPGGHVRRAMAAFPIPGIASRLLERFFHEGGRAPGVPYTLLPLHRVGMGPAREQVTMLGAFVEVWLARQEHAGEVGINLLTKVQFPNLAVLYGAMLAGVGYVLMGAGIPKDIPGILDRFANHAVATMRLEVEGAAPGTEPLLTLDPSKHWGDTPPIPVKRPRFLAIVASNSLATMLARKASGKVDGFVIEGPTAGGHNAPPRGAMQLSDAGEPIYGDRDLVDLEKMKELGVPFWLAGGTGSPQALKGALAAGAAGVQVGTLFAFSEESGIEPGYKSSIITAAAQGEVSVFTDPLASPTGYPFKVVHWPEEPLADVASRERICDLGYLRSAYQRPDGKIGFRCAAEPVDAYVKKGGQLEETVGRRCLCNALLADIGYAQERDGHVEPALITSGDDLASISNFLAGRTKYTADDVLDYLTGSGR